MIWILWLFDLQLLFVIDRMSLKNLERIVVFGAEYCGFCKKAHSLLSKANVKFSYLDTEEEDVFDNLCYLQKKYKYRMIPMIFIDEQFIGGYA